MGDDAKLIEAVLRGDIASFEPLIEKYQSRIFVIARRYAKREDEVEDIVQEVFIKCYQKLNTYRGEAPFEHWLMRLTIRTCYDFLRKHQRSKELLWSNLSEAEQNWLQDHVHYETNGVDVSIEIQELAQKALDCLSPASRLIITLLEIEDRSVKEIVELTGWSSTTRIVASLSAFIGLLTCLRACQPFY